MNGLFFCTAMLLASGPDAPLNYADAREQSVATKRPMLVLVGADWCPACRVLKHSTLPRMQRNGQLKEVIYATIDVDREPQLARRLMRSSLIPQLFLYAPAAEGWYRMHLQGAQDASSVTAMINKGIELQRESFAARPASPATPPTGMAE